MDSREKDLIEAAQRLAERLRRAPDDVREKFEEAVEGHGASFDRLVTLADGDNATLMGWLADEKAAGRLERVNGEPDPDGSLVTPSLFHRPERRRA